MNSLAQSGGAHLVTVTISNSQRNGPITIFGALRVLGTALGALLCMGLLIGCQLHPEPPAFQISLTSLCGLAPDQYSKMDQSQVRQWLENQYAAPASSDLKDGLVSISAGTQTRGGATVFFLQDRVLMIDRVIMNGPTFGQIANAFGSPTTVYGMGNVKEVILLSIGLDYPALGISVFMSKTVDPRELRHDGQLEIQLKEEYQVTTVKCYAPRSSVDDLLRDRFSAFPTVQQYELKRRKSWAGFGDWIPLMP